MAQKRKDNKGRILKTGESQRKDGSYQYRYKQLDGKWHYAYAPTLEELREKEKPIQKDVDDGIKYSEGNITVLELLERYLALKQRLRYHTKEAYRTAYNLMKKEAFSSRKINTIRVSDAKLFYIKLQNDGRRFNYISNINCVLKPAFQMAVDEDIIRKNPFGFSLAGVIENDTQKRIALTSEQQQNFLEFVRTDNCYKKHYDEFVVLCYTGLRVSELCGITLSDLDFEEGRISVNKQLTRHNGGMLHIEKTKTDCGTRYIPMSSEAYASLSNLVKNRKPPKTEVMIDGVSGFLLLDRNGNPETAWHIEGHLKSAQDKYNRTHKEQLPHFTPHSLRHSFCTNMANHGMDVKSLQYVMGHSNPAVTMGVYAHSSYAVAAESMKKVLQFPPQKTG